MSGPQVVATETEVFVSWGGSWGGPVYRLSEDGTLTQQWRVPGLLAPMIPKDDAAEWAADLLAEVKMSRATRKAVGDALGVDLGRPY